MTDESEKFKKIQKIKKTCHGAEPRIDILAFGLDERQAHIVEAAVIDLIGIENLTNEQKGHGSALFGRRTVDDIYARFSGGTVDEFKHDIVLIRINKLYDPQFNDMQLYEATRGIWEIAAQKREIVTHACAVYDGVIREVYEIASWHPAGSTMYSTRDTTGFDEVSPARHEFVGKIAAQHIAKCYRNLTVNEKYLPFGFAGSTRFVGPSFPLEKTKS